MPKPMSNAMPASSEQPVAGELAASAGEHAPSPAPEQDPGSGKRGPGRRGLVDRRMGMDRRQMSREESGYTGPERRSGSDRRTGLERRRGPGRRRSDSRKAAEEGEMTAEQFEFVMAIEAYKKVNKRMYPTWTEILEVVQQLGYRKVLPREVHLENVPEPELEQAGT